jgi:CHAD domain-containing protein
MRDDSAAPENTGIRASGDRAWHDAGRDSVSDLASMVRERARELDDHPGVDEIHDMRTATRRLRTAIKLHRDDTPKKRRVEVEDELRRVTRRLGAVRDLDVLLEVLDTVAAHLPDGLDGKDVDPLRKAWRTERDDGARRLQAELDRPRFRRALKWAEALVPREADSSSDSQNDRVATQAPGLIWDAFGAVLAYEVDPRIAAPADIHQVRIAAKKLRYTLEAFEDALQPGATLIEEVKALQDSAGSMHDAIVAGDRARSTVRPRRLSARQRQAIDAFADVQANEAERLRPTIARRLRTVRSRAFRESLGRAVAGMGYVTVA